jgi:hypothetical protein
MQSRMWRTAIVWRAGGEFVRLLLERWMGRLSTTRIDCFQQGMLETLEFSDRNRTGYGEAM